MSLDGSSALYQLGENPLPMGTPDELRKAGFSPSKIGSCAIPSPGVRGCPFAVSDGGKPPECIFNQPRYGGFKFKGPRNVGFRLRTTEGRWKQDFMTCHGFVRTMKSRMILGEIQRTQGLDGELVRIVAQEGEKLRRKIWRPVDPKNKDINAPYQNVDEVIEVPRHPRPTDLPAGHDMTFEQAMMVEERDRLAAETGFSPVGEIPPDDDTPVSLVDMIEDVPDSPSKVVSEPA